MKKQIILASIVLLSFEFAIGADYQCSLDEQVSNVEYTSDLTVPLDAAGAGAVTVKRSAGGLTAGDISVSENKGQFSLIDPGTNKITQIQMGADLGTQARISFLTSSQNSDYLFMSCQRGDQVEIKTQPLAFDCTMKETQGTSQRLKKFTVMKAQSGHDIQELPLTAFMPVYGWILAYEGNLAVFVQNTQTKAGMTIVGTWDQELSVQWHPSSEDAQVEISCAPRL